MDLESTKIQAQTCSKNPRKNIKQLPLVVSYTSYAQTEQVVTYHHVARCIHATDVPPEDACRLAKSMQPGVGHVACCAMCAMCHGLLLSEENAT